MTEAERQPLLSQEDHQLSMRISPRARRAQHNTGLRSLLVHRLLPGSKAVFRVSLERGNFSVHCEPCNRWERVDDPLEEWRCERCGREYEAELIVYNVIED